MMASNGSYSHLILMHMAMRSVTRVLYNRHSVMAIYTSSFSSWLGIIIMGPAGSETN